MYPSLPIPPSIAPFKLGLLLSSLRTVVLEDDMFDGAAEEQKEFRDEEEIIDEEDLQGIVALLISTISDNDVVDKAQIAYTAA